MKKWIAFVPLRGGSKSIPDKNITNLGGYPLCYWAINSAIRSKCFDEVLVSTDSDKIKKVVRKYFPSVLISHRKPELATDEATTESVMLDFDKDYDVMCLVQATSPLTRPEDFIGAKEMFNRERADSLFTCVDSKRFMWNYGVPNYNPINRPRRQDFCGQKMENGAFYFTTRETLIGWQSRLGGKTCGYVMPPQTATEIDEPSDIKIVEALLTTKIKALFVDVDGTLTDGGMYYCDTGEEMKKFNTRDAHGMAMLRERGILIGAITSEESKISFSRCSDICCNIYSGGVKDKVAEIHKICEERNISLHEIAYIGDDVNDIGVLNLVGFSACPNDAHNDVKSIVSHVCTANGGHGAVREVCDMLID